MACGIFRDQGLNPCPLLWQVDSYPLYHQRSPNRNYILKAASPHTSTQGGVRASTYECGVGPQIVHDTNPDHRCTHLTFTLSCCLKYLPLQCTKAPVLEKRAGHNTRVAIYLKTKTKQLLKTFSLKKTKTKKTFSLTKRLRYSEWSI